MLNSIRTVEFKPRSPICLEKRANTERQTSLCAFTFTFDSILSSVEMDSISLYKWTPRDVSNLNNPGKGYIDRMIYDCHDAVIEINVNELRYLVE